MGDTMGGGEMPYKVPDWKIYQVGNHTPELENVQRMLSSLGLKDPWIRNEVWRFDRNQVSMADRPVLIRNLLMRGMKPGFALAVVTAGIHYYLESKNDHGHH